jgi:cobalt-zinc-cadmium efflux system outer membrane protein
VTLILSTLNWGTAQADTLTKTSVLTERDAIAGALSRPAWVDAETGRIALAESMVTETGMMPNPVFSTSRDRLGMAGGDINERSVQISQTLDLSGRRSLRLDAASGRLNAEKLDGRARRLTTIAEVRRAFAETLYRDQIRSALELWLTRIDNAVRVTVQLAKAGEVSGYDRRRIQREAQTTRARLAVAQADAARSRESLAELTGNTPAQITHLLGNLLPDTTPSLDVLQARLRERPDLESLVAQTEAFEREQQAAQRGWIPDLTVGLGQKTLEEPTRRGSGAIIGVSFSIPLFDHSQAVQQRSQAKAQIVRSEQVLALNKAQAQLRGAWRQADELRNAALAYRHEVLNGTLNLSEIAEAAYRAGEAGLLELLDAYRTELDFSTTELDLALRARLAHIDLETLSGVSTYE